MKKSVVLHKENKFYYHYGYEKLKKPIHRELLSKEFLKSIDSIETNLNKKKDGSKNKR